MDESYEEELARIAAGDDPRREAYMLAAEHIAAALDEDPAITVEAAAEAIGRGVKDVEAMLAWRESGYKAEHPFPDTHLRFTRFGLGAQSSE